jgi:hypothetical protein
MELDGQINEAAKADPDARRLLQLRGIGPVIATALVACVGDARQFANGRQMAASLGLTPRQHSSGGKDRLLGISKRGDAYVRSLLVHGARAMLRTAPRHDDPLSRWVTGLASRSHPNVACVAMANKTARMARAMLRHSTNYQPALAVTTVILALMICASCAWARTGSAQLRRSRLSTTRTGPAWIRPSSIAWRNVPNAPCFTWR